MRKILSAVLAVIMVLSCTVFAFAESMQISTKSEPDYTLSFPADTEIPWESPSTVIGEVKAVKMLIEPQKTVKVSVTSENSLMLVNSEDSNSKIAYTLEGAENIAFLPGDIGKGFPLSVNIGAEQWATAASGEHRDILTFVIEYTDA